MSVFFVYEWFSVTREKDRKRIEKKIRQTLGEAKKNRNSRRDEQQQQQQRRRGRARTTGERDNVYSYSRHKNEYVFELQKLLFLNCFIKKKTFGKASGRKRVNASSLHEPTVIRGFVHIYI